MQYNLNKQTIAYLVANGGEADSMHCRSHRRGFWFFCVCAEVCVLILINQQDRIEARMALSLSREPRVHRAADAGRGGRMPLFGALRLP